MLLCFAASHLLISFLFFFFSGYRIFGLLLRSPMLCSDCQKVFSEQGKPFINYHGDDKWGEGSMLGGIMHKNFTSLEEAAKQRCQICEPLWKRIMAKRPPSYKEPEGGMGTWTILSFEHSTSVFSPSVLQIRHRRFGGGPHVFPEEEAQLVLWPLNGGSFCCCVQ